MRASADYSHLRNWTPISFAAERAPSIIWADLRRHRFERPFFDRMVKAICAGTETVPTEITGLAPLPALDTEPSLDPSLIIAHSARCGSTLLVRIIGSLAGTVTISEPAILDSLLTHGIRQPANFPISDLVRQLVRALGRVRFGNETSYVLKLNSSMTRFLPQLRRAFPSVPVVWLQRRPIEILESNMRGPGRWIGFDPGSGEDLATLIVRKMAIVFHFAKANIGDDALVLDYRDLPDAAWKEVAPRMGIHLRESEIARMREIASYDSKSGKPYERKPPLDLPLAAQAVVRETLDPLYEALDRRRARAEA